MKMWKIVTISILISFVFQASAWSQEDKESTLKWFNGGTINVDFAFQTDLFHGLGAANGNSCISLERDGNSMFWNPAQLGFLDQRQIAMDFVPAFSVDIGNLYDVSGEVETSIDDAIADYKTDETTMNYTSVNPVMNHSGGIHSILFTTPIPKLWKDLSFGFAFNRAMDIQFNMIGNGLSTLLETEKDVGNQAMIVKFRTDIDMSVQLRTRLNRMSFALAKKWSSKFSTGFTVDRYYGNVFVDAKFMIDGIMETAGSEFAFNDPYDNHINFEEGEQNNLNQSIYTEFDGKGWGFKLGTVFQPGENFAIGTMLELVPKMSFEGDMLVEQNKIPALNDAVLTGDADDDEEIMNPIDLNLAKLTLTEPYQNPTDDKFEIQLPSSFTLGMAYKLGFLKGNLNISSYFGQFSFSTLGTTRGAKFKYGLKTMFDLKIMQLNLGVTALDEVKKGTDEDDDFATGILVPTCSFSFKTYLDSYLLGLAFNKQCHARTLLFLAPTPIIKESIYFYF